MLDKAKALLEYKLNRMNQEIGSVKGFYFYDRHWAIRYLAADTGPWLPGRQVLISPHAVNTVSRERHRVVLGVTRRQIEDAPSLDPDSRYPRSSRRRTTPFTGGRSTGAARTRGARPPVRTGLEDTRHRAQTWKRDGRLGYAARAT